MNAKIKFEPKPAISMTLQCVLVAAYFAGLLAYAVVVNERVVLKTDVVTKVEQAKYAGGKGGSRTDRYYLQNQEYYLENFYARIPSLRIILERGTCHAGDEIAYYADPAQIKQYENRRVKKCAGLGLVVGKDCPKRAWYWFTLLSYVQKSIGFILVSAAWWLLVPLALPRHARGIWRTCMVIYIVVWSLVF